jgi:hypothetical protein
MQKMADRERSSRDGGNTFIETVVAVTLSTIVILPLLAAVMASVRSSTTAYDAAKVETALIDVADQVTGLPFNCGGYAPPAVGLPTGWGLTVQTSHLVAGAVTAPALWNSTTPCDADPKSADLQLVTLTVTDPDLGITRTMEVVKTDG